MVGYSDPDGTYHPLQGCEELVFEKSPDGRGRVPSIHSQGGTITPLNAPEPKESEDQLVIDRDVLNSMVRETATPGALFGKYNISDAEREQIEIIIAAAEQILEERKQDPLWLKLQNTIKELKNKGEIMSFDFPPSWLADAGQANDIELRYENNLPEIYAPSKIYNLYIWMGTLKEAKEYATSSAESLKGRLAKPLGESVGQLAHLLRQFGKIK